jgi:pyruvate,water dikinase
LVREFAIPSIFGISDAAAVIRDGQWLSLDASRRAVYDGLLWPDVQERVRLRIQHPVCSKPKGFLNERILALNLLDPHAASFRPKSCRSIHDIVRFVHEKAIAAMFEVGDACATV